LLIFDDNWCRIYTGRGGKYPGLKKQENR